MSTPPISVLLAVHNGAATLLASVRSVLTQTFRDFELLVIDDGSTDETPALLRSVADQRLRVLHNERNLGLTRSLNRGLREARGAWIARQDADDLSAPDRFARQWEHVQKHPRTALLGSCGWRIDTSGRPTGSNDLPLTPLAIGWASATDNPFLHTSVLFSREAALAEGGYDETFSICQDFALWSRLAQRHPVANLPERLVAMREHPASMTRTDEHGTSHEADAVLAQNWRHLFPGCHLEPSEEALIRAFRLRFPTRDWPPLRALLSRLFARYCAANPEARNDADVRATRARQSLRVAWKFLGSAPWLAAQEIAHALALAPAETARQGLTAMGPAVLAPRWITS